MRRSNLSLAIAWCVTFGIAAAGAATIEVRAARVLNGRGDLLRNATIVIEGSTITRIGSATPRSGATTRYDLGNATILPGGIDTHVHIGWHFDANGKTHDDENTVEPPAETMLYAVENAWATLMGGITTVQSLGAPVDGPLRDRVARGTIPGPRILTAIDPIEDDKLTPDQMREAVRQLAAKRADVVKIFASQSIRTGGGPTLSQEQLDAICGEAKARGLRTAVHAHGPESVRRAVLAGCTSIEHGALIGQPELDLMAAHGTYFDPNIDLVFRNYFENRQRFIGIGSYSEEGFAQMEKAVPKALEVFRKALKTPGLKVVFGTDAVAGAHGRNFEELIYRVQKGGQDPMAAIVSATSLAAECLGLQSTVGTLAPAMQADLIAVDGNPLEDITALKRVIFVMRGGVVYKNEPAVTSWRGAPSQPAARRPRRAVPSR